MDLLSTLIGAGGVVLGGAISSSVSALHRRGEVKFDQAAEIRRELREALTEAKTEIRVQNERIDRLERELEQERERHLDLKRVSQTQLGKLEARCRQLENENEKLKSEVAQLRTASARHDRHDRHDRNESDRNDSAHAVVADNVIDGVINSPRAGGKTGGTHGN